ncbi:very large low complexity protein [Hirsutella rhossiliensis]|uniref:ubiquitinyl hydrolase 1 n=1 Tax=Hirsutella rhossiliensis TaxID=111463 RepID=A0A9P8SGX2_9HYPO|nr:very large low complexity protein [Hirsutella rhossiliensis]KAH0962523.1 very large low complexity protein [Hirsutella rhossiliensis]
MCRRLAKLEQEKSKASKSAHGVYQALFDTVGTQCESIIAEASLQIENAWDNFKKATTRLIPLLPSRAKEPSLHLSLPRSGEHLRNLLQQPPTITANDNRMDLSLPPLEKTAIHELSQLASRYFKLADLESSALQQSYFASEASRQACQDGCVAMAESLFRLLAISEFKSYTSKPDQMSLFILKVFELWVEMDKCAVTACPLLGDYHPLFPAEALDVLHLAELSAMNRLQQVQGYLRKRRFNCKYPSENILLSEKISSGTCVCTFDADGSRNVHGCAKCYHWRVRKRMTISVHESYLPADSVQKSTVAFELAIPPFIQTYRNATWKILHQLGHPGSVAKSASPTMLLKSYSQLTPYNQTEANGISMASAKKSFLQTHYKQQRMKVDLPSVVLPCGLSFEYYDEGSQSWVSNFKDPVTFQHLCGIRIPRALLEAAVADPRMPTWTDDQLAESHYMELLITLALRLHGLTSGGMRQQAYELLKLARRATLQWSLDLRDKIHNETDANEALRVAQYRFQAALLCRRTFRYSPTERETMDAEELSAFVEASISLQQSLVVDPTRLTPNQESMLMRDLKMAYRFRSILRESVQSNPEFLGSAFCGARSWEPREQSKQRFTQWRFLDKPNDSWIASVMRSEAQHGAAPQVFHYNIVEGHLLVDGQPLGRPPLDIIGSTDVKYLFGKRNLLTYPSYLTGMSHVVAIPVDDHHIHFGRRGDEVVIRAIHWTRGRTDLLEYIPGRVFRGESDFDLPSELVDSCAHWLNLSTGDLEIRRQPTIWTSRPGNWTLNVQTRQAKRRETYLVDPHSEVFGKIKDILQGFENFWSSLSSSIATDCFSVGSCKPRLIPNQDAGALYGFEGKIVLRDMVDGHRRSIIAGLGELSYQRRGIHVAVRVKDTNAYGKFDIDGVLGRLTCPPETRLLYSMALFHASTSFPLPDPLTASTGAEEAYRILGSGACQPWMPLADGSRLILKEIEQLCPRRDYYPRDKRILQTVQWNRDLTMEVQHDSYGRLIGEILLKSMRLHAFHTQEPCVSSATEDDTHSLQHRATVRRSLYERSLTDSSVERNEKVVVYESRDRIAGSRCGINVYQTAKILYCLPFKIPKTSLAQILQDIPGKIIGGFHAVSDSPCGSLDALVGNDVGEQWGSLVNLCRNVDDDNIYDVVFRLGLLAFSTKPNNAAIRALCAFSRLEKLRDLQPPDCPLFTDFKYRASLTLERLEELILVELPAHEPQPATLKHQKAQSEGRRETKRRNVAKGLAKHLLAQWPCATPSTVDFDAGDTEIPQPMERVHSEWTRLHNNLTLSEYLDEAQAILDRHIGGAETSRPKPWDPSEGTGSSAHGTVVPSLSQELLLKQGPSAPPVGNLCPLSQAISPASDKDETSKGSAEKREMKELGQILTTFANSSKPLWQQYGKDLLQSHDALRELGDEQQGQTNVEELESIDQNISMAREVVSRCVALIANALSLNDNRFRWLRQGNLWPRVSSVSLLQQLRSNDKAIFGPGMKELLVFYGTSITTLQWLLRIRHAFRRGDRQKLLEHCSDRGHSNWDPIEFPDWLLLEIESNLLIRPQHGKRKTSCIVPMVVAVLADSKQLCRLIVPKALLLQTAQTLQSKIGGLLGREMRQIPFSRRTPSSSDMQKLYVDLHRDILGRSGVILAIPEHIMSYKLSGFQKLADSKLKEAREMMAIQSWLTKTCRDVLDESDFTLAVKTQLIYPSGQLVPVDGHPDRWKVVERAPGFPMIYIVQSEIEDTLRSRVTDTVCDGHTSILRLPSSYTDACKACLRRVLTEDNPDPEDFASLSKEFAAKPSLFKNALIIRGLLLKGILLLCLRKRWNVQYGLHPKRDPLAVPFEAKGVPSEQAEFGHPDVAIIFTCLSFYYAGLTIHQFQEGLGRVLKSDDPASEYDSWTAGCDSLPEALSHWNLINVDDTGQVEKLWNHLRLSREVLDHYLNTFVFPRYAKQFAVKLQSSGWDLPLLSSCSDEKKLTAKTTGFSGTNDNRRLLPLTIRQDDLPSLKHTSAEVLTCLLQDRNRDCMIATSHGARLTEEELLKHLSNAKIRLLIDAGAYILEMDNQSLIKKCLQECLVYLDEAHTRGTDLKLPPHARGALTLALGQTKDHTVQAAMRLRQLATTQSVTFCAPPEVYRSILDLRRKKDGMRISSFDVVHWLLEQTCRNNEQLRSLFNAQGIDFCRRTSAARQYPKFLSEEAHTSALLEVIRSPEQIMLDELYGSAAQTPRNNAPESFHSSLRGIASSLMEEKPHHYKSLRFSGLHPAISSFVQTGLLDGDSGFELVSTFLANTGLGKKYNVRAPGSRLFVSAEFTHTIENGSEGPNDNFLRPIEWVLWGPVHGTALVIIPEEVELLIPVIRAMERAPVHLIPYAASTTNNMVHSSELAGYVLPSPLLSSPLPSWLSIELGLLGARLYFDFEEYSMLLKYLRSVLKVGSTASAGAASGVRKID